jgi:hypothetical protein
MRCRSNKSSRICKGQTEAGKESHKLPCSFAAGSGAVSERRAGPSTQKTSASILLFRKTEAGIEVLLGHPGGPFWKKKDHGACSIPKGLITDGEEPLAAAKLDFREETGYSTQTPRSCR